MIDAKLVEQWAYEAGAEWGGIWHMDAESLHTIVEFASKHGSEQESDRARTVELEPHYHARDDFVYYTVRQLQDAVAAERDVYQRAADEMAVAHKVERDGLEETVRQLNRALRDEIEAPTFMGEPVSKSLLREPVKSLADIKVCYCPPDQCQAPVIMGRQVACTRKMHPDAAMKAKNE